MASLVLTGDTSGQVTIAAPAVAGTTTLTLPATTGTVLNDATVGVCRAWVNFNGVSGASPVIRASFNISSVTRSSAGIYSVAFTNAFADTNYAVIGTAKYVASAIGQNVRIGTAAYGTAVTTTAVAVEVTSAGNAANTDSEMVNVAIFR